MPWIFHAQSIDDNLLMFYIKFHRNWPKVPYFDYKLNSDSYELNEHNLICTIKLYSVILDRFMLKCLINGQNL